MPDLTDTVEVGGTPGSPNGQKPITPTKVRVSAKPQQEYTSGSALSWYVNLPRSLPWTLDDLTRDFGSDIYERMLYDSQVRAVVNVLKASILEDGVHLTTAVPDKGDTGYKRAGQLVDDAEAMLDDLDGSFDDALWDMLDAVALGNRVAEMVYEMDSTQAGRQALMLRRLSVKPRESTAFIVDAYMRVLGIIGRIPGQPFGVQQGMLLTQMKDTPNVLPRSKFAVLTFRPRNNDPRGTSVLRAAYTPWNAKQQVLREWLRYLSQFAVPSLIGFTPETADAYPLTNPDGTPMLDTFGNPILRTPEEDMVATLGAFANGTVAALPYGADVKPIEMNGNGEAFVAAFNFYNGQITKAVLHQTLATEEGLHQTRAASGQHQDILDGISRQAKRPIERMIHRDILRAWVRLNWGERAVPLTPQVSLGQSEQEDIPRMWEAAAKLYSSGYTHPSQLAEQDEKIGMPERDLNAVPVPHIAETIQVAEDAGTVAPPTGDAATTPPAPPQQPPGAPQATQTTTVTQRRAGRPAQTANPPRSTRA